MPTVTLYVTGWCPYCARARQLLARKGAAVEEIDIEAQPILGADLAKHPG